MEYYKTEFKTGIVVITCLILLFVLTIGISGTKSMGETYNITVLFENITGLETNSPVNYAGFEVGNVENIRLTSKNEKEKYPGYNVATELSISTDAVVRENSIIQIKTLGYIGLKYLDINPGDPASEQLNADSTILGYTPQSINDTIDMIADVIDELRPRLKNVLSNIERIVGEDGELTSALLHLDSLMQNTDKVVKVNKEDIRSLISNLEQTSENLKGFAKDIKEHPWKLLIKTSDRNKISPKLEPLKKRRQEWKR